MTGAVFNRPLPTDAIGNGLGQLGAGLEDLATPLAKIQGQEDAASAVTRNPDGSIAIIDHPASPILGKAGEAYTSAVDTGVLAASRSQTDVDLAKIATQFQNAPDQFQNAAAAYVKQKQDSTPGPIGIQMAQYAQAVSTQHETNLIAQKQRSDLTAASTVMDDRQKQIEDQMDGLAGQGGLGSSQFAALDKERSTILAQKVGNPAFAYTADQKAIDDANLQTRLSVATLTGAARDQAQKTGNVGEALQTMDAELRKLPIPEKARIAYEGEVTRHLSAMSAISAQQRQQLADQADTLRFQSAAHPDAVQPQQFDDLSLQLERSKMFAKSAELQASKIHATIVSPMIVGGTVADAQAGLHQVEAMAAGGHGGSYFTNLRSQESGGNDVASSGIAQGRYQFTAPTWAAVAAKHPDLGLTPDGRSDPQQQDRAVVAFTNDNKAALTAAGIQPTDANTYMAHFLGSAGATSFIKAMQADPSQPAAAINLKAATANPTIFYKNGDPSQPRSLSEVYALQTKRFGDGTTPPDAAGSGAFAVRYSVAVKDAQSAYNTRAQQLWSGMETAFTNKQTPTPQEFADIKTMLPDITDANLRQKISEGLATHQVSDQFAKMPVAAQNDAVSSLELAAKDGQVGNVQRQMLGTLREQVNQQATYARDDPVSLAALKVPPQVAKQAGLPAVQPLDANDANSFINGLRARQTWKNIARSDPSVSEMPLQPPDIASIKAQAPNWTGAQAQTALGAISSTLTGPEQDALMGNKDFKETVLGLAHSGDPAKMNAAYSLLDSQYRRNPMTFQAEDGGKSLLELRSWQTLGQYLPPQEVANRMASASDPSTIKAKEALEKVADKNLEGLDASNIVRSVYGTHIPLIGAYVPFTAPGDIASERPAQATGALQQEYRSAYSDMFKETGDANASDAFAKEKLGNKYSVSTLNGGRVMAYAPDREVTDPSGAGQVGAYYPKVKGSFDYLREQLVRDATNTDFFSHLRYEDRNQSAAWARSLSLVPDAKTEADIASKRPPSYQVLGIGSDGRMHLLSGNDGRPMRFRGDPSDAQARAAADISARRANAVAVDAAPAPTDNMGGN